MVVGRQVKASLLCNLGEALQPLWAHFPSKEAPCSQSAHVQKGSWPPALQTPPPWSRQAFLFTRGPSRVWEATALASSAPHFLPLPLQCLLPRHSGGPEAKAWGCRPGEASEATPTPGLLRACLLRDSLDIAASVLQATENIPPNTATNSCLECP